MTVRVVALGAVGLGGTVIMGLVHIRAVPRIFLRVIHGWSQWFRLLLRWRSLLLLRRIIFGRCLRRLCRKFSNWRQDGLCSEPCELGLRKACDEMSY
jgi:hypothetical protein